MDKPIEKEKAVRKTRKPRKDKGVSRPKKTKTKRRDPNIVPIWTNSETGIGVKQVNLPARLSEHFIQRFGLLKIPNEAELVGWIEIQSMF